MRRYVVTAFILVGFALLGIGCSEPDKGDSVLKFSVGQDGARVNCPYGALFVVPPNATTDCQITLTFSNTPPASLDSTEQVSFCVHVKLSCGSLALPALFKFPLWRTLDDSEQSKVRAASLTDSSSAPSLATATVPDPNTALVEIQTTGFYWVVVVDKP